MPVKESDSNRRNNERLNLALQISLSDKNGKTINISAGGVYFEVITDDIDAFAPGTTVPIQIIANTTTPGFEERKVRLSGRGSVVRNCVKDVTSRGNRLGIALEFKDKLDILPNEI